MSIITDMQKTFAESAEDDKQQSHSGRAVIAVNTSQESMRYEFAAGERGDAAS